MGIHGYHFIGHSFLSKLVPADHNDQANNFTINISNLIYEIHANNPQVTDHKINSDNNQMQVKTVIPITMVADE